MRLFSVALIAATGFALPVVAAPADVCSAPASKIEQLAAADPGSKDAAKALRLSKTGRMLCDAGSEREAEKKFRRALVLLKADEAPQLVQQQ